MTKAIHHCGYQRLIARQSKLYDCFLIFPELMISAYLWNYRLNYLLVR